MKQMPLKLFRLAPAEKWIVAGASDHRDAIGDAALDDLVGGQVFAISGKIQNLANVGTEHQKRGGFVQT